MYICILTRQFTELNTERMSKVINFGVQLIQYLFDESVLAIITQ